MINDHSRDRTLELLKALQTEVPTLRIENNAASGGFGMAVRWGLDCYKGDAVAVYMADASDSPRTCLTFGAFYKARMSMLFSAAVFLKIPQ